MPKATGTELQLKSAELVNPDCGIPNEVLEVSMTMRPVSGQLFVFKEQGVPSPLYERCSAADLGVKEAWLRDAIFQVPELVIGPCRAAGLTEDEWYPWQREYGVAVGSIDVLLVSSQGRVAIVETKLASNPELRRRVLAQTLDYLTNLADAMETSMPEIPKDRDGDPVADVHDIRESISQGDVLVIIASDDVDPNVARLSRNLLSNHVVKQWDLALVDLALYRLHDEPQGECLVVPHVRGIVESEPRQVVRVVVEGETPRARVEVARITSDGRTPARQRWDEVRFFNNLDADIPPRVRELASKLRELAKARPDSVTLAWGTGRQGSMVVKRNGHGVIEVYGSGMVRFRPRRFGRALGEKVGLDYRRQLEQMIPHATMKRDYPRLSPGEAAQVAPRIYTLIERVLAEAERKG